MARQLLGSCLPAGGCAVKLLAIAINNQWWKSRRPVVLAAA